MLRRFLCILLCSIAIVACDDQTPAPEPPGVSPTPPTTISGTERLGWSQIATDTVELGTLRYAIYVDGVRSELGGASCAPGPSPQDFDCSAPLPAMSPGTHTLELATFIVEGGRVFESARSSGLEVNLVSLTSSAAGSTPPAWPRGGELVAGDGVRLRLGQIAGAVVEPTDLAFAPDGRLFVADRTGIRVVRDRRLLTEPALALEAGGGGDRLLALAVDPAFDRTHFVYTIYTTHAKSGMRMFCLARFREVSDTLGDRIILLDGIPATSATPSASLRFGPDGKLYAAFDDAGVAQLAGDLASVNGKMLRLNSDGTTPSDQAGGNPLFSYSYRSPRGLDWHPTTHTLWIADRNSDDSSQLSVVATIDGPSKRGVLRAATSLPTGTLASSMAFYRASSSTAMRDNLFVASEEGRHLLRIYLDAQEPPRIAATERLLQDVIGGIRVVAVGPEGALYVGTANALGRLVPMN